jgi:hypothetical protein
MKALGWVMVMGVVLTAGCRFTIKIPQAIEYTDASLETMMFSPSILPAKPARLAIDTTRYQPVRGAIDMVALTDISAALVVDQMFNPGVRIPIDLIQDGGGEFLNEQGSNELTARLTAELPSGVGKNSVRAVEVTFRGQTAICPLAPPKPAPTTEAAPE